VATIYVLCLSENTSQAKVMIACDGKIV